MGYISQFQYYENGGGNPEGANWGSYQYVSLYDIVNNVHSGLDVDKVPRAPARRPLCCLLAQASGCCHRT